MLKKGMGWDKNLPTSKKRADIEKINAIKTGISTKHEINGIILNLSTF